MLYLLTAVLLVFTRGLFMLQNYQRFGDDMPKALLCWPMAAPVVLLAARLLTPAELLSAPAPRPVVYAVVAVVLIEELALAFVHSRWCARWSEEHGES